jgi:hypothetical protein
MLLEDVSVWFIFLGTIGVVVLAVEGGYRLGLARHRRSQDEKESPVAAMSGAIVGLAAFMLAFTFGIASERHQTKQALVREEAVSIRTAWNRADFLPDADRPEAADLLQKYVTIRVDFAGAGSLEPARVQGMLAETEQIQNRLWAMAVANARKDMNSDVAALYIDSLNKVNELHAMRVAVGMQARVPTAIWVTLYAITIMGMLSVGYQTGIAGSNRTLGGAVLALAFALAFALIAALDHPDSGFAKISQQPLIDVRDLMAGTRTASTTTP